MLTLRLFPGSPIAFTKGVKRNLVVDDAFNAERVASNSLSGEVNVFGGMKLEPDVPNLGAVGGGLCDS